MSWPLVTCLCLTMEGRKDFLSRAIESFRGQTYPNRELLIVADRFDNYPGMPDQSGAPTGSIWCESNIDIMVSPRGKLNIGQKRNVGCASASGNIILHWDDDDYSSRFRITHQVHELETTSKAVTGYSGMKFTDGASWWQFRYQSRGYVLGTSLAYLKSWWVDHPFLDQQIEDPGFVAAAREAGQLAEVPDIDMMYATIHAGNSSKRNLSEPEWTALPGFRWRNQ